MLVAGGEEIKLQAAADPKFYLAVATYFHAMQKAPSSGKAFDAKPIAEAFIHKYCAAQSRIGCRKQARKLNIRS